MSEWKWCFFSRAVFFSRSLKMSEWVKCKLFQENKKQTFFRIFLEKIKNTSKYLFFTFSDLFLGSSAFLASEWLTNFSEEKKVFFFPKVGNNKKKTLKIEWESEWQTFPGKSKNTIPLFIWSKFSHKKIKKKSLKYTKKIWY